jgi:hypothetical protein
MARSSSVFPGSFRPLENLPTFFTTATPSPYTDEQLYQVGFRKQAVINIRVKSLNYGNCRAFHEEYLESWWVLLGQEISNIEMCEARLLTGTQGDLLLSYYLHRPVHLARISGRIDFEFIAPGELYCNTHQQWAGRIVTDPPTSEWPAPVTRTIYCCGRVEDIKFKCWLLTSQTNYLNSY